MTWIMYSLEYVRCSQNKDMKGAIHIWRQYVTRFCHVPYVCFLKHLLHPSHPLRMSCVNVPSPMLERHSLETGTPIWPPSACIVRGVASNVASSYPIPYHGALGTNRAREQPTFSITSPKSEGFGWNPFDLWASFLDSWGGKQTRARALLTLKKKESLLKFIRYCDIVTKGWRFILWFVNLAASPAVKREGCTCRTLFTYLIIYATSSDLHYLILSMILWQLLPRELFSGIVCPRNNTPTIQTSISVLIPLVRWIIARESLYMNPDLLCDRTVSSVSTNWQTSIALNEWRL